MKTIDANLALRFILEDIPAQAEKVAELIDQAPPGGLLVPDLVFAELVWVLGGPFYHLNRQLIGTLLEEFIMIPEINCNQRTLRQALTLYRDHRTISFIDAYGVIFAQANEAMPLVTFDKKLAKALPKQVILL
jgi:predicted nucleic-acid-binding protein